MRKKFIWVAALCAASLYPASQVRAAVEVVQEVQQSGKTVKGKVLDKNGEPVIGANVMVKGTTIGVITDIDGNFTLNNASGTLVISYIGYQTVEIKCNSQDLF